MYLKDLYEKEELDESSTSKDFLLVQKEGTRDVSRNTKYDSILKELCKNNMIKYISMYDVLQNEDFVDGLHPNENGYKKIFETLIKYL